jgi:hypothetical protein
MPTQISRPYWILALLIAVTAQAQDLHIKKSITVGGNFISSTETSIKGPRERTVTQLPTGTTITLRQCDLKRTITINEQAQTYFIANDPPDDAAIRAAALVSGAPQTNSGGYITETSAVTDTGERKTMYGYPARHLKAKVTVRSSQNACSQLNQSYEVDGWYADVAKGMGACQQFLPPVQQNEGCTDRVIRKRSGSAKPGYPLVETLTFHNADGSTAQIGMQTSEITKPNLEKELFDVPAGYREVKSVAELKGAAPAPQMQQPTAYVSPGQTSTPQPQNPNIKMPSTANLMFNPAAQMAFQQQANALGRQMMGGAGNPYGTNPGGMQSGAAPTPAALGPKAPGKIRIGVAAPDAQVGQGNNSGGDYSTPIRNAEIALMSGPAIDIAPLDSHIAMQLQAEAQQKQCDYIMYSSVSVKHSKGGFGRFAKFGSLAASMTPMGAMAHGATGAVAAQAASVAASQMAQQQAMNQLANFNGQIKSKDDVTVQYQLVAIGQTSPVLQSTLQGRAKSDGEDVLTPLLQQTASAVLTQVSQKKQ